MKWLIHYDVYYRVHAQSYGWLDWAKNGESAGTQGLSKRLEAIEIVLVEEGGASPGPTEKPLVSRSICCLFNPYSRLRLVSTLFLMENYQEQKVEAKRMEAIKISLDKDSIFRWYFLQNPYSKLWLVR